MEPIESFVGVSGNHVVLRGDGLGKGMTNGMDYVRTGQRSALVGREKESVFITPAYRTERPFNDLVASWNVDTPPETECEVYGRLYIGSFDGMHGPNGIRLDGWTDWISWGRWSPYIKRSCPRFVDSHIVPGGGGTVGWAYANAFFGAGDSSINTRKGIRADAFQLKAVLRSSASAEKRPSLSLLAATWKNTDDPNWPSYCTYPEKTVSEDSSVLLRNVPAISQMRRDPYYARVICSATCAAMAMNAFGAQILPEDVALLNYDYGFGGNGNWSFTCAAAGAYGFESYVSYSSFNAIRQELVKGNAVCLSVKYTNKKDDPTLPYLENAPCRTNGHLICVVGYEDRDDLGETIYYVHDPAAESDASAGFLEYREPQLDLAWYRRACYFIHGPFLPAAARTSTKASLVREADKERYLLVGEDGPVTLPADYVSERFEPFGGHGTICWYVDDQSRISGGGWKRCVSNNVFHYDGYRIDEDGAFVLTDNELQSAVRKGERVCFAIIGNDGRMMTAQVVS